MNRSLEGALAARLAALDSAGLRFLRVVEGIPGARAHVEGRERVNFASNNYLDLAGDGRVRRAAVEAAQRLGGGATASRLLGGALDLHRELEAELADFKEAEAALVFPSGYHANLGMVPALAGPGDVIFLDRLAHASLVDGARLSGATLRVFPHNDVDALARALKRRTGRGEKWVVTESVFSMDGDRAPLGELASVCERAGARLYVDEAHGTGVWGPGGRGCVNAGGIAARVDVCMGTLSKALGAQGGFVTGSRTLMAWAVNRARSFIYSTALAPAAAGAALAALRIARAESERRERLFALAARLRDGLGVGGDGPIVPFPVGDDGDAVALSRRLWEEGVFAPAIRPPTVPRGTARIRFSVTAGHREEDVDRVVEVVDAWMAGRALGKMA